jgi:hypothetical protein
MLLSLLFGLVAATASPSDTSAVYEAILREIRSENPGSRIVLATARSAVECMPLCGAFGDDPAPEGTHHPSVLLSRLRDAGLVDTTCVVPPRTYGCTGLPNQVFVALGPVADDTPERGARQEGAVWVRVAILRPTPGGASEGYGYRALVSRATTCTWRVVRKRPEFVL